MSRDIVGDETLLERAEAWARILRECVEKYELSEEERTIYEATAKCFESASIMKELPERTKRMMLEPDIGELREMILDRGWEVLAQTTVEAGFKSAKDLDASVTQVAKRRIN